LFKNYVSRRNAPIDEQHRPTVAQTARGSRRQAVVGQLPGAFHALPEQTRASLVPKRQPMDGPQHR